MCRLIRFLLILVLPIAAQATMVMAEENEPPRDGAVREWTDTTGTYQIDAQLLDYQDGQVRLRRQDGTEVTVPMSRLSRKDRDFVRAELRRRKAAGKTDAAPEPHAEPKFEIVPGVGPADDPVDRSRGLGILPLDPARPYLHVEGDAGPRAEDAVRARYADPARDQAPLVEAERERLKTANQRHLEWEQKIGYGLIRVETHHIVVHAQLPAAEARRVGMALEALKIHLQRLTGNLVLTPLRPDVDEMVIVLGKFQYLNLLKILEQMYAGRLGDDWHLMPELAGGTIDRTSFSYTRQGGPPPAHMALFQFGGKSIRKATAYRAPFWLAEGFAAYCENSVTRKNLVHSVRYENKNVLIGDDWSVAARRLAAAGQLRNWDDIFARDLADYQLVDYVQAYAMVAYLFETDPQKFLDFAERIKAGETSQQALEAAYALPPDKLQQNWLVWLKRGG